MRCSRLAAAAVKFLAPLPPADKSNHWLVLTPDSGNRPRRARRLTVQRRCVRLWLTAPANAAAASTPIRKALYPIWIDARDLAKISTIENAVSTVQFTLSLVVCCLT